MKSIKLVLTTAEKESLKQNRIRISELNNYAPDELGLLLAIPECRAKEICALIEFQRIPSVGPKFAQDLVAAGYYSINELKDKDAAQLLNNYEQQVGAWADPCLEDQFRLVVYYANNPNSKKQWWDFTAERKAYRMQYGYPTDRPEKAWYQLEQYQK